MQAPSTRANATGIAQSDPDLRHLTMVTLL